MKPHSRCVRRAASTCCAVLAVPAAASATWTTPTNVGVTDDIGSGISVAVNPSGSAVVGWTKNALTSGGGPGAVQFAFRPAEGVFAPAVNPDPFAPEFPSPGSPDFAGRLSTSNALASIGLNGEATVVWLRTNNGDVETSSTSTGVFSAPQQTATALTERMRMDRNVTGDIAIVNHNGLLLWKAQTATAWASTSFGAGTVREANVSVDPTGVALIAWIDTNGRIKTRRFNTKTGAFVSPTRLIASDHAISVSPLDRFIPTIGIGVGTDAKGRGVVVWRRTLAGRRVVRATFVNANATARAPGVRSVSATNAHAGQFDVAMAANGNATIAYNRSPVATDSLATGPVLLTRRSPIALNWTTPAKIATGDTGVGTGAPSVAMAKTVAYVTWLRRGHEISDDSVYVARRVGTGPWVRTELDGTVDDRGALPPEVHARGSWAIVGWRDGNGLCCADYVTSLWDPTP
jgi:hypothetical protein